MKNPIEKGKTVTKKNFQQVADIIRKRAEQDSQEFMGQFHGILAEIAEDFVQVFQQANPRFSVEKFYTACGMDEQGTWVI